MLVSVCAASSAAANSNTSGVPSPPNCLPRSAPGNGFSAGAWLSGWWRSAQCAASATNRHSCSRTVRCACATSDRVVAGSGPPACHVNATFITTVALATDDGI